MALGLPYLRAIEAAGALPLVIPPLPEEAIEPLLDRLDGSASPAGRTSIPRPTAPSRTRNWARPSPTSTASSWRSRAAPTRARSRCWPSAAAPRRSTSSAAARSPAPARISEQIAHRQTEPRHETSHRRVDPAAAWRRRSATRAGRRRARRQLLPPPGDRPRRRGPAVGARAPDGTVEAIEDPAAPF